MKYERERIDAGAFADILPEGATIYERPELPMVKFEKDKIKYEVTDIRLLNELAIGVFEHIIYRIAHDPEIEEVKFIVKDLDDDKIDLIIDIVTGIEVKAEKGGEKGWIVEGRILECSAGKRETETEKEVIFKFYSKERIKAIHNSVKDGHASMADIAVAVVKSINDFFEESLKKQKEQAAT